MKLMKRVINGVLLLDKPVGLSSNVAMQKARALFRAQKAGHTGVLDPLASGLLPICFGEATKFAQYLLDADKAYIADLYLGKATTTGDAEGEVIASNDVMIDEPNFQAACEAFVGEIMQTPPMYSALKYDGKPLYEYARQGITIERKQRKISIYSIGVKKFDYPYAQIEVCCSKGTYIRTLAEDIAKYLGSYAYLTGLRRTATAGFNIEQSYTLKKLSELSELERDSLILPCDSLLLHLPSIELNDLDNKRIMFGQRVPIDCDKQFSIHQPIRAYSKQGEFIGLVEYISEKPFILKGLRLMKR